MEYSSGVIRVLCFTMAATGCTATGGGTGERGGDAASSDQSTSQGQLGQVDFGRPWLQLPIPVGSLDSVQSISEDAQGYVALIRHDSSMGKVTGEVTHRIVRTEDGTNWSSVGVDVDDVGVEYLQAVAYGNGSYVIPGNAAGESVLRVSSNAVDWTAPAIAGVGLVAAKYAGGKWFAVGAAGYLATSTDGLAWHAQQLDDGSINDVAFGNGVYVAAGNDAFWISSDALAWEAITTICPSQDGCPGATPPSSSFPQAAAIAVDNLFFAQGNFYASSSSSGYHFVSANARDWVPISPENVAPDLFAVGVFLSITSDGIVRGSTDGSNWTYTTSLTIENPNGRSCAIDRCFTQDVLATGAVKLERLILIPTL